MPVRKVTEPTVTKFTVRRQLLVLKFCTEFRENQTNGLVSDFVTDRRTHTQTDTVFR